MTNSNNEVISSSLLLEIFVQLTPNYATPFSRRLPQETEEGLSTETFTAEVLGFRLTCKSVTWQLLYATERCFWKQASFRPRNWLPAPEVPTRRRPWPLTSLWFQLGDWKTHSWYRVLWKGSKLKSLFSFSCCNTCDVHNENNVQ